MKDLPKELLILAHRLEEPITDNSIKKYLRKTYKHYLKKESFKWSETIDGIYVTDIKWGRKILFI